MSNASTFRRYYRIEESMIRSAMPRISANDPTPLAKPSQAKVEIVSKAFGLNLVRPLTFKLAEVVSVVVLLLVVATSASAQTDDAAERKQTGLNLAIGTMVALQAADAASTYWAINSGNGVEGNPAMQGLVGSPAKFVAVKAATTTVLAFALKKVGRDRPKTALAVAWTVNAVMAAVVANNVDIARGGRR